MPKAKSKQGSLANIGEFGLIDLIKGSISSSKSVIQGIGDDTAILAFTREEFLLFTTDMLVDGVHFQKKIGPTAIGRKVFACNLSDIAAMGGTPLYAVVSLGLPKKTKTIFVKQLYKGIQTLAKKFKVDIVGGDTVCTQRLTINIALVGKVKKSSCTLRAGAKKGDQIFVTGKLGRSWKTKKHFSFTPRIKEAQYLVKCCKPSAMIDISDGLVADLEHILKQSKVGAVIDERLLPKNSKVTTKEALYDGEDFELLFTVSPAKAKKIRFRKEFTRIGEITNKRGCIDFVGINGRTKQLTIKGYTHF